MSSPESIPEDKQESFQCPVCADGSVTLYPSNKWECDTCNFVAEGQPVGNGE